MRTHFAMVGLLCLGLFHVGCDDSGGSAQPFQPISRGDGGLINNNPAGSEVAMSPSNGGGPGIPVPNDECVAGSTRCPQEGGNTEFFCRADNTWAVRNCSPNHFCQSGGCVPNPVGCVAGERTCLGDGSPAVCQNDSWAPLGPCANGTQCLNGDCLTEPCVFAARSASYLGCDYLTLDMPNASLADTSNEGTPDAPVGLVIANSSPTESVSATVYGPDGAPSALVASVFIPTPDVLNFDPTVAARYQPRTIQSQVRDSAGAVLQTNIALGQDIQIPPGGTGTFLLPRRMAPITEASIRKDAFRVQTTYPVVAYQFSPYCCNYSFSNDASLLLPTTALGTEYRYVGVPSWTPVDQFGEMRVDATSPAIITVVSPSDRNQVRIQLPPGTTPMPDPTGQITFAGTEATATLNSQDVMVIPASTNVASTDFTGSLITSNSPVAVFSNHNCSFYPSTLSACDHLQEQLFPVSTWGRRFQLVPVAVRNRNSPSEVTYWKLLGANQTTRFEFSVPFAQANPVPPGFPTVQYCGSLLEGDNVVVLPAGQTCEFGTRSALEVVSDQPAMVMGIVAGQRSTGLIDYGSHAGDPAVFLVPPDEQFRRDYTFLAPETYYVDYVTVVSPPGNEILLDDSPINFADATEVSGSIMQYKHIQISDGPHRLQGRAPFGIVVHAYDDFVSYAFTGGLNLRKR